MGNSPLLIAIQSGNLEMVQLLIEKGDANTACVDTKGITCLIWAAAKGHIKIIDYLAKNDRNLDVDIPDKVKNVR